MQSDAGSDPGIDLSRPYFIGIGGVGMSGVAKILASRGMRVSGSDLRETAIIAALRRAGCDIHIGHDPEHVLGASCVVISQAIREHNIELRAARERGLPVAHRAEVLGALMDGYRSVAVAGTHGKSSTTTMLAMAFQALGLEPSFVVGADLDEPGNSGHHGTGDLFVAEADESDRSFHYLRPLVAMVLNVEEDHHDHYASLQEHVESYETFAHGIQSGGTLVVSADDPGARQLLARLRGSAPELLVITYGEAADADVQLVKAAPHGFSCDVSVQVEPPSAATFPDRPPDSAVVPPSAATFPDRPPDSAVVPPSAATFPDRPPDSAVDLTLNVPGRHMAHNATAALAAAMALGIEPQAMGAALAAYRGIQRRFTRKGQAAGVLVVDSYAHHPSEIAADLETARQSVGASGRVVVVFQPHLPSRTRALGEEIGRVLAGADLTVIMDVYQGREDPIPGVTNRIVALAALEAGALVRLEPRWAAVPEVVAGLVRSGDLVLTMGAGDVTALGPLILTRIQARAGGDPEASGGET